MKFKSVKEMQKKYKRTLWDDIQYYGFYIWWNVLTDLKWKVPNYFERAYYGVGHADVWSFDNYLSSVILRGLKQLKKYKHGIPCDIYEKYNNQKLTPKQKDKLAIKEWDTKLDIMIRGFEIIPKLYEDEAMKSSNIREGYIYEFERGMDLFKKYYFDLWD
jgi:hypothetical protein